MKRQLFYSLAFGQLFAVSLAFGLPSDEQIRCHLMARGYHGNFRETRQVQLYITSNVDKFKDLNTWVDHEGNEHVSNVWHLAFQRQLLNVELEKLTEREVGPSHSIMAKTVDSTITIPPEEVPYAVDLIQNAKADAANLLAHYIMMSPEDPRAPPALLELAKAVQAFTKLNENTQPSPYTFGEGNRLMEPISPEGFAKIHTHFRNSFSSVEAAREWVMDNFGIGVGLYQVDAHTFANGREVALFDLHAFLVELESAQIRRHKLQPMFEGKNRDDMRSLFGEIRSYLSHMDPTLASPILRLELGKLQKARTGEDLTEETLPFLLLEVESYVRAINILDFLPQSTIDINPQARFEYEALGPWQGAIYGDILRLGATNLSIIHENLDETHALVKQISIESVQLEALQTRNPESLEVDSLRKSIMQKREQLTEMRQNILNETGLMVNRVHGELMRLCEAAGMSKEDFRMIAYGDDFFIVWRAKIPPETILKLFSESPILSGRLRMGAMANEGKNNFLTLSESRGTIGLTGEALKKIEGMGLGVPAFIFVKGPFKGEVKLLINGEYKKPTKNIMGAIRDSLPFWQLD